MILNCRYHHIIVSNTSLKTRCFGLHFCRRTFTYRISSTAFTQCAPEAAEFGEITQNKSHYAVQGHSRSPISVPIESSYNFLLVINTNLGPTSYLAPFPSFDRSKIAIFRCIQYTNKLTYLHAPSPIIMDRWPLRKTVQ